MPRCAAAVSDLSAMIAAGGGLGMVLAGPIVTALDYRWLFWIPVAVVAATTLIALRTCPSRPTGPRAASIGSAPCCCRAGWSRCCCRSARRRHWGWGSARVLGLFVAAVLLFALWLDSEARSRSPLIDMRMMRLPARVDHQPARAAVRRGMYSILPSCPSSCRRRRSAGYGFGASITAAGLLMLPMLVAMFCLGVLSGRLEPVSAPRRCWSPVPR